MCSAWFDTRTWLEPSWSVSGLVEAKEGRTVSVVLPALNEAPTVGDVVRSILPLKGSLVDDVVVMDSGSIDGTAVEAALAGARVVSRESVLPEYEVRPGKGEVLWRSLAATTSDLIVFMDSDLIDPDPMFVPNLLGPLLLVDEVELVKGFFSRSGGGGRVTELTAKPLLSAFVPELGALLQPLSGQCAGTRSLLESIPFADGYGVEIGMVLDSYRRVGMGGLAQVNLGVLSHESQELSQLAHMSRQVVGTLLDRCGMRSLDVVPFNRPPLVELTTPTSLV